MLNQYKITTTQQYYLLWADDVALRDGIEKLTRKMA